MTDKIRCFHTRTQKSFKKLNILRLDLENDTYMLFKDIKECDACSYIGEDEIDTYLEYTYFEAIKELAKNSSFDEIKRIIEENDNFFKKECLYTRISNNEDEEGFYLVDTLEFDHILKTYKYGKEQPDWVTDGYTELGEEIYYTYVSKQLFEIILLGLKQKGYKKDT